MNKEYGFKGRLTEEFPSQVLVDATEVCNLSCIHCPHPTFKKTEHYGGRFIDEELNKKMVEEVRVHGKTLYIRYASNGEPLVHPKIFEMLAYAKDRSNALVTLTTNGKILNEKRTATLLSTKVDVVDISLDAFSEDVYAGIRVGGDLAVTRGNVLRLIKSIREENYSTKVVVSFVEQPQNKHETRSFEDFWNEHGADYVVVRRLHSCSGAKGIWLPSGASKMMRWKGGHVFTRGRELY
jgi:MoaA/NifB/PqqE/SkfB family radical SAM enzyme